jgi:NADPH-dependent ferric siderophore reductase
VQPLLWRLREQFPRAAHVVDVAPVARRMRRIRLAGDSLRGLPWIPGQQLRVRLTPTIFMRDSLRTYSVWRYDADVGLLDLCILLHGDAPGARWAAAVRPGDDVTFWGPRGSFVVDPAAAFHVFAGEETGAVAIQAMIDALPPGARAWVRLEADTPEDELPQPVRDGVDVRWLHRRGVPAGPSSGLADAVRGLALPAGHGAVYLAGEATTCRALRDHFVRERGWPRHRVRVKPFWMSGKRGLE